MRVRLLACAIAALATACASLPPAERSYSGRFSATAGEGAERHNLSGRFSLEVGAGRQTLDLATPIGTTVARVQTSPGSALISFQGQEIQGTDADALTERVLGWRLPVSGLADWIEARPVAGRPARVELNGGRIASIEQDGWTIRVTESFDDSSRPRRLSLERPAAGPQPAVSVRLVLDGPAS